MAAREALAARPDHKTLLAAQKPPVVSRADSFRIARRSHHARQLPYRAPVVSRADSFRIARRSYRAPTASLVLPVSCRQNLWWRCSVLARADSTGIRQLSSSSTLVALNSFDCAASLRKRRPSAAGSLPRTHSAGPVVSDLLY